MKNIYVLLISISILLTLSSNSFAGRRWNIISESIQRIKRGMEVSRQLSEFRQVLRQMGIDNPNLSETTLHHFMESFDNPTKLLHLRDDNGNFLILVDLDYTRFFFRRLDPGNKDQMEALFYSDLYSVTKSNSMTPDLPEGELSPFVKLVPEVEIVPPEIVEINIYASLLSVAISSSDPVSPRDIQTMKKVITIGPDILSSSYLSSQARRAAIEMMFDAIEAKHIPDRKTFLEWWSLARRDGAERIIDKALNEEYVKINSRIRERLGQLTEEQYPELVDVIHRRRQATPDEAMMILRISLPISYQEHHANQFIRIFEGLGNIIDPKKDPALYLAYLTKMKEAMLHLGNVNSGFIPDGLDELTDRLLGFK